MAVIGLIFGRKGSESIRDKNVLEICGRPMMEWPITAAKESGVLDDFYVSTDSERIAEIAVAHGLKYIKRPPELATSEALVDDAFSHAYKHVCQQLGKEPEMIVSFFCNAATVLPEQIRKAVQMLRDDPTLDSAATVSKLNMYSPLRAKKLEGGLIDNFIPIEFFPNASCKRDSQGDVYYVDASVWALRPRCFDFSYGKLPYRWLGRKIGPIFQEFGCDVDSEWQVAATEWWLKKYRGAK